MKLGTGGWGPHVTAPARDVLAGGDIFPSGHVSNVVVLFGVLAILATRQRKSHDAARGLGIAHVGLSTLYLDPH